MQFGYLERTINLYLMLTSLEIAKLLRDQKRKQKGVKTGFDSALIGLGVVRSSEPTTKK